MVNYKIGLLTSATHLNTHPDPISIGSPLSYKRGVIPLCTTSPLAVEEFEFLISIKVFPNPSTDIINIEADELLDSRVYLINTVGRRVSEIVDVESNDSVSMDVNHLNSGLYYVVIEKEHLVTTRKVIISNL